MAAPKYGFDNPKKALLLDWLLDPFPQPETLTAWAAANGVGPSTPSKWKADPKFRREWERQLVRKQVDPERTDKVITAMREAAECGDVQAAKLYMAYIERFAPPPDPEAGEDYSELSDEELDQLIYAEALAEKERRGEAG